MPCKKTVWIYAVLSVIVIVAILIPVISKIKTAAQDILCKVNFDEALPFAVGVYMKEYDRLPAEDWCDIFIEDKVIVPQSLVCLASDAVKGESSYAMNKNVAGMKYSELSGDVVLFFETDKGCSNGPRNISITTRRHYVFLKEREDRHGDLQDFYAGKDFLVYKDRFNQYGGPEDAAFRHRQKGKNGCHVMYVDGRDEFVSEDRISDLKWTVEYKRKSL
jgi:hypothetical protein